MRLYFELVEKVPKGEETLNIGGFLRIPIKDKKAILLILKLLKDIIPLKNYKAQLHYCYHDEGRSCKLEEINLSV